MSLIAVPASFPIKRRIPWTLALFVAVALVGVVWIVASLTDSTPAAAGTQFFTVAPMDLDITISKDGELQACNNVEINSPVEGQNVILDIAKEGSNVHK